MKEITRNLLTYLAPLLGAGGIGVCPLCWAGSASFLSYLGFGALIPWVRWISFGFIALGGIGFLRDFRLHRNAYPLWLLIGGAFLLYLGRYVYGGTDFGGWPIWGPGALLIVAAVLYNRQLFAKHTAPRAAQKDNRYPYACKACGFRYQTEDMAKKCEAWCTTHKSCNLEIIQYGLPPEER